MIKLLWEELHQMRIAVGQTLKAGDTFETDLLDYRRGVYRVVEVAEAGIHVERVCWVFRT